MFFCMPRRCLPALTERLKMDRRRLEQAHFRFAVLKVFTWYPNMSDCVVFKEDAMALAEFTTKYQKKFHEFYSGNFANVQLHIDAIGFNAYNLLGHRCSKKGCWNVFIIDGNLKNHRSVCAASEAGFIEYDGLPGYVKSGCTNTPEQTSRFCSIHKPCVLVNTSQSQHKVIEMILSKKSTRSGNMYQVLV